MSFEDFVDRCQRIGRKVPGWTQGPGGNVSYKEGDHLWVKASGFRLDQVNLNQGVACVDLSRFTRACLDIQEHPQRCEQEYSDAISQCSRAGSGRASMETGFHALLPSRYVIHFHSIVALLMAYHQQNDKPAWEAWMQQPGAPDVVVIPACMPGWWLTQKIVQTRSCPVYLLANHGVVLASQDLSILEQWESWEQSFCHQFGYQPALEYVEGPCMERELPPCPLRLYFPDTAVFLDRLHKVLEPTGAGYALKSTALTDDLDAAEIWKSTQMLYQLCPSLTELPPEIANSVASLPTEKFRRGES